VLDPAILETKFQRPHIACRDQFPGLHAEVRTDLFHQFSLGLDADPASSAEGEIVGPEGCAGQSQAQAARAAQLQKGASPDRSIRFVGIHSQVMGLIRNGQEVEVVPLLQSLRDGVALTACGLVRDQQAVSIQLGVIAHGII